MKPAGAGATPWGSTSTGSSGTGGWGGMGGGVTGLGSTTTQTSPFGTASGTQPPAWGGGTGGLGTTGSGGSVATVSGWGAGPTQPAASSTLSTSGTSWGLGAKPATSSWSTTATSGVLSGTTPFGSSQTTLSSSTPGPSLGSSAPWAPTKPSAPWGGSGTSGSAWPSLGGSLQPSAVPAVPSFAPPASAPTGPVLDLVRHPYGNLLEASGEKLRAMSESKPLAHTQSIPRSLVTRSRSQVHRLPTHEKAKNQHSERQQTPLTLSTGHIPTLQIDAEALRRSASTVRVRRNVDTSSEEEFGAVKKLSLLTPQPRENHTPVCEPNERPTCVRAGGFPTLVDTTHIGILPSLDELQSRTPNSLKAVPNFVIYRKDGKLQVNFLEPVDLTGCTLDECVRLQSSGHVTFPPASSLQIPALVLVRGLIGLSQDDVQEKCFQDGNVFVDFLKENGTDTLVYLTNADSSYEIPDLYNRTNRYAINQVFPIQHDSFPGGDISSKELLPTALESNEEIKKAPVWSKTSKQTMNYDVFLPRKEADSKIRPFDGASARDLRDGYSVLYRPRAEAENAIDLHDHAYTPAERLSIPENFMSHADVSDFAETNSSEEQIWLEDIDFRTMEPDRDFSASISHDLIRNFSTESRALLKNVRGNWSKEGLLCIPSGAMLGRKHVQASSIYSMRSIATSFDVGDLVTAFSYIQSCTKPRDEFPSTASKRNVCFRTETTEGKNLLASLHALVTPKLHDYKNLSPEIALNDLLRETMEEAIGLLRSWFELEGSVCMEDKDYEETYNEGMRRQNIQDWLGECVKRTAGSPRFPGKPLFSLLLKRRTTEAVELCISMSKPELAAILAGTGYGAVSNATDCARSYLNEKYEELSDDHKSCLKLAAGDLDELLDECQFQYKEGKVRRNPLGADWHHLLGAYMWYCAPCSWSLRKCFSSFRDALRNCKELKNGRYNSFERVVPHYAFLGDVLSDSGNDFSIKIAKSAMKRKDITYLLLQHFCEQQPDFWNYLLVPFCHSPYPLDYLLPTIIVLVLRSNSCAPDQVADSILLRCITQLEHLQAHDCSMTLMTLLCNEEIRQKQSEEYILRNATYFNKREAGSIYDLDVNSHAQADTSGVTTTGVQSKTVDVVREVRSAVHNRM